MNVKRPVYSVPVPSTAFTTEPYLDTQMGSPTIRFSFEDDTGHWQYGLQFKQVSAFRKRSERCCGVWNIEDAYDVLVEIEFSTWITEIFQDVPEIYQPLWKPKHFMIYLDSAGCFEFLAQTWEVLPPISVTR